VDEFLLTLRNRVVEEAVTLPFFYRNELLEDNHFQALLDQLDPQNPDCELATAYEAMTAFTDAMDIVRAQRHTAAINGGR